MRKPLSRMQRLLREKALSEYLTALERGDIDQIINSLERAEHDPGLEQMILEVHDSYQTDEELQDLLLASHEDDLPESQNIGVLRSQPSIHPTARQVRFRRPRLFSYLSLLAAVLLTCLVVATLLQGRSQSDLKDNTIDSSKAKVVQQGFESQQGWCNFSGYGNYTQIRALAALSTSDVWLVGEPLFGVSSVFEHWDGQNWSIVTTGQLNGDVTFDSLAAISTDDIWAAGSLYTARDGGSSNLHLEHWNGSDWQTVSAPDPVTTSARSSEIFALSSVSTSDIWALGQTSNTLVPATGDASNFLEHWNGQTWSLLSIPAGLQDTNLTSISAASAKDIWLTGNEPDSQGNGIASVLVHWDGRSWSRTSLPNGSLQAISVLSPQDAWAVGSINQNGQDQPLITHWDGRQWQSTQMKLPDGLDGGGVSAIIASSPQNIWALGHSGSAYFIEHWDGTLWHLTGIPSTFPTEAVSLLALDKAGNKAWLVHTPLPVFVTPPSISMTC